MVLKGNICALIATSEVLGKRYWNKRNWEYDNNEYFEHYAKIKRKGQSECIYCKQRFPEIEPTDKLWAHLGDCVEWNHVDRVQTNKKKYVLSINLTSGLLKTSTLKNA